MEEFRKMFIEEAYDLCKELEQALFKIENNPGDKETIGRVFRVMHNMKGNSAIFGFKRINEFTHNLETIYDLIRNDKMAVSKDILNLTLVAVDHLRILIEDENLENKQNKVSHENLIREISQLIDNNSGTVTPGGSIEDPDLLGKGEENNSESIKEMTTYHVLFHPEEGILTFGNNPLYILDELSTLGNCKALSYLNDLPLLSKNFDASRCYCSWEVFLATDLGVEAIRTVFLFVEEESKLEINALNKSNLFKNKKFLQKIDDLKNSGKHAELQEIQAFVKGLEEITEEPPLDLEDNPGNEKTPSKLEVKQDLKTEPTQRESTLSSIRVSSDKLDTLMNLISELVTTQAGLSLLAEKNPQPELLEIAENIEKISRRLRDNTFSICLVPIESMLTRFQRLVRDLSHQLKKDIVFVAEGAETELDKTIVENLTDPLMHIFRNSMDHGIEDGEVRVKRGKPSQGKILLKAFYSGANVHIHIQDDGGGIDPEKVKQKAISKGLITADSKLIDSELLDLIFLPGFSTVNNITEVSGRGVGMDVVKRKIADLRGEVKINSQVGMGTTIIIILPLTLSIIDGLLVKIDQSFYVIPLSVVERCCEAEHSQFENKYNDLIVIDGEQIPFISLRKEFNISSAAPHHEAIVLVKHDEKQVGLVVDHIVGQYQAVLKPLGKQYKEQEIISGATILGDGTIALVLDTYQLICPFINSLVKTE